jgi:hypothetical protein
MLDFFDGTDVTGRGSELLRSCAKDRIHTVQRVQKTKHDVSEKTDCPRTALTKNHEQHSL